MNNIYEKYCNDIQNPALGSILISLFANEYCKNSILNKSPNLLYAFIIIPLLFNKDMRLVVVDTDWLSGIVKVRVGPCTMFMENINEHVVC